MTPRFLETNFELEARQPTVSADVKLENKSDLRFVVVYLQKTRRYPGTSCLKTKVAKFENCPGFTNTESIDIGMTGDD